MPTQAIPLLKPRWAAKTAALPLLNKLELHLWVRRSRARRVWSFAWAAAVVVVALGMAGFWFTWGKIELAQSQQMVALEQAVRQAAESGFATLAIDGPEGARVKLNGVARGTLPIALEVLAPGPQRLEIDGRPSRGVLVRELELSGGDQIELRDLEL
jgi:hypothetical protein